MKKTLFVILLIATTAFTINSQVPEKFNYQATIRSSTGELLISKDIKIKISILKTDVLGPSVYTETHALSTTDKGIINLHVGAGSTSDDFSAINWYNGPYFLKVEVDPDGGDNFVELGTSEILSVPYAIAAGKAGSIEWEQVINKPNAELPLSLNENSLSIQKATSSNDGYLSSDDWNLFNNKSTPWGIAGSNIFYNNGNVGIGTSDPIVKLNIVGNYEDGQERALIRLKNLATGDKASVSLALQAYDDKGMSMAYTSPNYGLNDLADFGVITTNGRGFAIAPNQGQIRFYTNRNYDGSYSEKMRIDQDGHVGIGTENPTRKLHIETNSDNQDESRDLILLRNLSSGSNAYTCINLRADDNNYGLGITFTSSNYSLIEDMQSSASIGTNGRSLSLSTTSVNGSIRFLSNPMQSGLIEMMRLDVNGNLGIGTKVPHAKLEIADGDIFINDCNKGIIMKSPDGQCWRGKINNSGVLEFVSVPCPSN